MRAMIAVLILHHWTVMVVAPFPPEHPYNYLNPFIDSWWHDLDEETQKQVYSSWEDFEPLLLTMAKAAELRDRIPQILPATLQAAGNVGQQSLRRLLRILTNSEVAPPHKQLKPDAKDGDHVLKSKVKFKTPLQRSWEKLQSLANYNTNILVRSSKAEFAQLEELVRLLQDDKWEENLLKTNQALMQTLIKSLRSSMYSMAGYEDESTSASSEIKDE